MYTETPSLPSSRGLRWRALLARAMRSDVIWLAGCVLAIAAGLQLAGIAASRLIAPLPPAPSQPVSHLAAGIEQAGNELLYRACVREARVRSLPVKPYPQESERVSFVHEGKRLIRQTETLEADVSDMSVDNGCQVKLQRRVQNEQAPSSGFTEGMRRMSATRPDSGDGSETLQVPLAAGVDAGTGSNTCILRRDVALQSHYMLLNLCIVERAAGKAAAESPRKAQRAPKRPTT